MRNVEELLSWIQNNAALFFLKDLMRDFTHGEVFFVGGAIRDWFLQRSMNHADSDLVVRGIEIDSLIDWLKKIGTVDVVGKTFGVIKFRSHKFPTECIDIALPRTEQMLPNSLGGYRDISVQSDPNLTIEKDLARRDFTVNAMALNLKNGLLIDPFGGQHDLEVKILSAVGYAPDRFQEDLTRILRGLRFACELNFEIEPQTFEAMKSLVPELNHLRKTESDNSYVVSRETIGDELSKAFYTSPSRAIHFLQELGALEELFPSVWRHMQIDTQYLEPVTRSKPGELEHTVMLLLRGLTPEEAKTTLAFTGLDTISKQSPRRLDVEHILWMIQRLEQRLTPQNISAMRASHFEKQFLGARGTQHMHLLEHLGHTTVVDAAKKRRAEICAKWQCEEHEPIPPLITGDDILRQGIPAGARVREILELVRDKQLDGHILTREAAIRFVKQQME